MSSSVPVNDLAPRHMLFWENVPADLCLSFSLYQIKKGVLKTPKLLRVLSFSFLCGK